MRPIAVPKGEKLQAPDQGPAPMLQWISVDLLVVDDTYQRDLGKKNWTAIRKIAATFRWSRFSPVFVAPVEGGRFAIIDGQHRTHAAVLCGIAEVPCQVVQMDRAEQAASFAAVNGLVTKVTAWNILKAALAAGAPWAHHCREAVEAAGCRLMTGNASSDDKRPGDVFAIALVRQYVEDGNSAALTLVLRALRASEFGKEAAAYSVEILKPTLRALAARPWLVKRSVDLSGFFDDFDIYGVLDRAEQEAKDIRRRGGTDVSRFDIACVGIGDGLDKAFPQRIALGTVAA